MSKIISIGTAVPKFCHQQSDILQFMQTVFGLNDTESRKLKFLYSQSGIDKRYSVLPDFSRPVRDWKFFPASENLEPFPSIEQRMAVYDKQAPLLSVDAIRDCLSHDHAASDLTHLITVSCTGLSAPGLDLQLVELLDLNKNIFRTSINFMGCYAAIHALKLADMICKTEPNARVMIVCTELCTLHFQKEATPDNLASSLLFGDGSAAALVVPRTEGAHGLVIDSFFSGIKPNGKRDMAWELSSTGFLMTLSSYVPDLVEEDLKEIVKAGMAKTGGPVEDVSHWCIHPGGKRILQAAERSLVLKPGSLEPCYEVLREYGNLSSATILFVLKKMLKEKTIGKMFAAAFGPGLTIESFTAHA